MYCVDDLSWRSGCSNTSARYSVYDITRRLRVKSSRTASPRPTSDCLTIAGMSSAIAAKLSLCGDDDRHRLPLRVAALLVAHAELEHAFDLVAAGLRRGRLDVERERLLGQGRRVALRLVLAASDELGLGERDAGRRRIERQLDREIGVDVKSGRRRDLERHRRFGAGLDLGGPDLERA